MLNHQGLSVIMFEFFFVTARFVMGGLVKTLMDHDAASIVVDDTSGVEALVQKRIFAPGDWAYTTQKNKFVLVSDVNGNIL